MRHTVCVLQSQLHIFNIIHQHKLLKFPFKLPDALGMGLTSTNNFKIRDPHFCHKITDMYFQGQLYTKVCMLVQD
jgi:hypothetical protein